MNMGCPELRRVGMGDFFTSPGGQVAVTAVSTAATFVPVVGPILGPAISFMSKLFGGKSGPTREQKVSSAIASCNSILSGLTSAPSVINFIRAGYQGGRGWPCAYYKVLKAYAPNFIPHDCNDQSLVYGKAGDPCAPVPPWLAQAAEKITSTPNWEDYIKSFFPPELGGSAVGSTALVPAPMGIGRSGQPLQPIGVPPISEAGFSLASITTGWTPYLLAGGLLAVAMLGGGEPGPAPRRRRKAQYIKHRRRYIRV